MPYSVWFGWSTDFSRGRGKAGEGNRTLVSSLEGYSFTIKLHPRGRKLPPPRMTAKFFLAEVSRFTSIKRSDNSCSLVGPPLLSRQPFCP